MKTLDEISADLCVYCTNKYVECKQPIKQYRQNKIKNFWLNWPMQLFIQGQWWSNLSTHWLQIAQWRLLAVLITLHSGHKSAGFTSLNNSTNDYPFSGTTTPGFLHEAHKNVIKTMTVVNALAIYIWIA